MKHFQKKETHSFKYSKRLAKKHELEHDTFFQHFNRIYKKFISIVYVVTLPFSDAIKIVFLKIMSFTFSSEPFSIMQRMKTFSQKQMQFVRVLKTIGKKN